MIKVVDANVVAGVLTRLLREDLLDDVEIAAPHLIDAEVLSTFRGLVLGRKFAEADGASAVEGFEALQVTRYPTDGLHARIWELRHNLTAYDASYVALAEALDAPLVTTDVRIREAPGVRCHVEVV